MDRIEYIRQINMRLNELEAKVEAIEQYFQNISEDIMYLKMKHADAQETIHARWVDGICTNCGVEKPIVTAYRGFSDIVYQYQGELNYCPNCGAKMDGGK